MNPPAQLRRAIDALRRAAFSALLAGDTPRLSEIAELAGRDAVHVAGAITWLEDRGALERDGDRLVGAHGLTRRATPHAFDLGGRTMHTWCAFDAVGIPVVLGATTRVTTACPTCRREIVVDIGYGRLRHQPGPVLWSPTGHCEELIADFCVHANLFCRPDHLDEWRAANAHARGDVVSLHAIPELAAPVWSDIVPPSGRDNAVTDAQRRG